LKTSQTVETTEIACNPPSSRTNFSLCSLDDFVFMFGGEFFNGNKTEVYDDFFVYNTAKNEWKKISASPSPTHRSGHQMIATAQNGGELYLFGGEFASPSQLQFLHFRDLWRFQLTTKKWEKLNTTKSSPSARSGHRMVLSKKKIFLFGGFHDNNASFNYFNDVWSFSLEDYSWSKVETVGTPPTPRSGVIMGATDDGKIIITGGYTKTSAKGDAERGVTHSDAFVLQEIDGKWKWNSCKPGGRRPVARSGVACTQGTGGRIYIFGGVMDTEEDDENLRGQFSNEIHFLDTAGGGIAWRKVELKTKKADKPAETPEASPAPVKTTTDGIFTITVGAAAPKPAETSTASLDIGGPSPRMNAGLVLVKHNLFIFGGSYEQGSRLFTLCDFHSLDVGKCDAWKTIIGNMPSLAWFGSDSEDSSSDGSNESMDDDDSDESDDDDEMDTE
jgi:N-acetylneuraminic acid mutarotase